MTISMSREELISWASKSVAFFGLNLSRFSTVLLAQSYSFEINRVFNPFVLTHPIKVLEGLSSSDGTGPPEQFNHPPLAGLYRNTLPAPGSSQEIFLTFFVVSRAVTTSILCGTKQRKSVALNTLMKHSRSTLHTILS